MRSTLRRAPAFAVACVAVLALAGAAGATFNTSRLISAGTPTADSTFEGVSADGSNVFFTTIDSIAAPVVNGPETDGNRDIYVRSGATTALVTPNTNAGPTFRGMSSDGSVVVLYSNQKLAAADTDSERDIYSIPLGGSTYTLLTPGTTSATAPVSTGVSADGSKVFFTTAESLLAADGDALDDIYESAGGTLTLLTPGTAVAVTWEGASADGSKVFFTTTEKVDPVADTDAVRDIYRRQGGVTSLATPSTTAAVTYAGISSDGSQLFFTSNQNNLAGAGTDSDGVKDIFTGTAFPYTLLTPGTTVAADYAGNSADGAHVFFTTAENLAGDADGVTDIFDRSGGSYTLVSGVSAVAPTFKGNTSDGTTVYFLTTESLQAADIDGGLNDVYEVTSGGPPVLVSRIGAGSALPFAAVTWGGNTPSGGAVYFNTTERLAGDDTDAFQDVYEAVLDSAAPSISSTQTPDGQNGWFRTAPASLHVSASDDIGLAPVNCTLDTVATPLANETATQTTDAGDISTSADGDHTVDCHATDGAGNGTDMATAHLMLDTQDPAITPSGNTGWFTTAPASLHIEASDGLSLGTVTCTLDGNPVGLANVNQTATTLAADVQTSADGIHAVVCTAYDSAGRSASTGSQELKLDTAGPLVDFSSTPDGSNGWFKAAPASVHVSASDASGIQSLTCTLDGNMATLQNSTATAGDVQTSDQGGHTVVCTATDNAGNQTVLDTALKLDSVKPVVTGTGPSGWVTTAPATLHVTATDANIVGVACKLNGAPVPLLNQSTTSTTIEGDVSTSVNGDHTVTCTATDDAGNSGDMTPAHLKLDTAPTTFTFTQTPNGTNGWFKTAPAKVRVTAADSSGVTALTCKLDGANVSLTNTAQTLTSRSGDVSTTAQGSHSVVCTGTDGTSLQTASSPQTLKLDSVAPVLTVANITVDPTGPTGATVSSYPASATDVTSPPATVTCTPAAPKLFPMGNTTVSCTAKDQAGNQSAAKTFTVHVNTVVDLLAVLKGMVTNASPPLGGTLPGILNGIITLAVQYMNWPGGPKKVSACAKMEEFKAKVAEGLAKVKPTITPAQAQSLTAYANKIKTLIPC